MVSAMPCVTALVLALSIVSFRNDIDIRDKAEVEGGGNNNDGDLGADEVNAEDSTFLSVTFSTATSFFDASITPMTWASSSLTIFFSSLPDIPLPICSKVVDAAVTVIPRIVASILNPFFVKFSDGTDGSNEDNDGCDDDDANGDFCTIPILSAFATSSTTTVFFNVTTTLKL